MKIKIILTSVILICCANSALAGNYYTSIDAGISLPRVFKNDGYFNKKPSKSSLVRLGVGYQFNEKFRSDVTLEFRNHFNFKYNESQIDPRTNKAANTIIQQRIRSTALRLNAAYDICHVNLFTPYVTAGVGVAFNRFGNYTIDLSKTNRTDLSIWAGTTNRNFTWSLGAGSKIDLSDNIKMGIAYRYTDFCKLKTSSTLSTSNFVTNSSVLMVPANPPVLTNDVAKRAHLTAHEITIGLSYKF